MDKGASRGIVGMVESARDWTPDFSAGVAELELESILTRFYLEYRAMMLASGVFETLARTEDVDRAGLAWGALAVEAADIAYVWQRTRRWKSLLAPDLLWVGSASGLASAWLSSRGMTAASQRTGPSWSNRLLRARVSMIPLFDDRAAARGGAALLHLAPHLVTPRHDLGTAMLRRLSAQFTMSFAQTAVTVDRLRRQAAAVDARADRFADQRFAAAVAAEEASFLRVAGTDATATLATIRSRLTADREAATELAFDEELRLRVWLEHRSQRSLGDESPASVAAATAAGEALRRRIDLSIRVGGSIQALLAHRSTAHRNAVTARLATAALVGRAAVSVVLDRASTTRRITPRREQVTQAATDYLAVVAASANQIAEHGRGTPTAWAQSYAFELGAAVGTRHWAAPIVPRLRVAVTATRAATFLTERRTPLHLAAGAANEIVQNVGSQHLLASLFEKSLDQAVQLTRTAATLAATRHQRDLDALRLRHQAFVHDRLLQVLRAVATSTVDDDRLLGWIDDELEHLAAAARGLEESSRSVESGLAELADEFAGRGLAVTGPVDELPTWTRPMAGTVVEIARESLNNTLAHTASRTVHWRATDRLGKWVEISIVDFSTAGGAHGAGNGMGTRTMAALAEQIGGSVEWQRTETGGTEVVLTLVRP